MTNLDLLHIAMLKLKKEIFKSKWPFTGYVLIKYFYILGIMEDVGVQIQYVTRKKRLIHHFERIFQV